MTPTLLTDITARIDSTGSQSAMELRLWLSFDKPGKQHSVGVGELDRVCEWMVAQGALRAERHSVRSTLYRVEVGA